MDKYYGFNDKDNDLIYYLDSLEKPILSKEEEQELFIKMKNGDSEAKKKIIESNLRLVVSIAKRYRGLGVELLDLIQEGNIGLMEAVERFDLNLDCKFSTYATRWIMKEVSKSIKLYSRPIRVPVHVSEVLVKCYYAKEKLIKEYKREPSLKELADELNITLTEVEKLVKLNDEVISLNHTVSDDSEDEISDCVSTGEILVEDKVINNNLNELLNKLFDECDLTEKDKNILELRFGFINDTEYTLTEISNMLGVSSEAIRQRQNRLLTVLRNSKYSTKLVDYLDYPERALEAREEKISFSKYSKRKQKKVLIRK